MDIFLPAPILHLVHWLYTLASSMFCFSRLFHRVLWHSQNCGIYKHNLLSIIPTILPSIVSLLPNNNNLILLTEVNRKHRLLFTACVPFILHLNFVLLCRSLSLSCSPGPISKHFPNIVTQCSLSQAITTTKSSLLVSCPHHRQSHSSPTNVSTHLGFVLLIFAFLQFSKLGSHNLPLASFLRCTLIILCSMMLPLTATTSQLSCPNHLTIGKIILP